MKCSLIALGSGWGSILGSAAELSPRCSDCPKSRPKLPQEFRTRIGETYSRIELECFSEEIRMESTISTIDLKSKLDQKQVTVVETLAPERYREAHIPSSLNIPPERIKELALQLLPNKNAEIVTYCANTHWHASQYAARELAAMGYKNVAHYPEGKQGWMEAGLPVEKAA
jgi:rhodanese-related sulfurtransferase